MRKMLLIGGLVAAASLLSGCMIISCDDRGALRRPCVIGGPSWRVGVVFLPRDAGPGSSDSPLRARPRPSSVLASCGAEKPGYNDSKPDS